MRKSNILKQSKSSQRNERAAQSGAGNSSRVMTSFTGKKMSRNSACLSPSSLYTSNKNYNNHTKILTASRRLTTTANGRGRNTAVGNQDSTMLSNGQQTLGLAYKTNAQMRQVLQESRSVGGCPGAMTKSHSQINGNNNTSSMHQHRNRVGGG